MRRTFTLRGRLAFGILGATIVLAVPLALAIKSLKQVHDQIVGLRSQDFGASLLLGQFRDRIDNLRSAENALLFLHKPEDQTQMRQELTSMREMATLLDKYQLGNTATDVRLALDSLDVLTTEEYQKAAANNVDAAEVISVQWVRPRIKVIEHSVLVAEQILRHRTADVVRDATGATEEAERTALASLIVALALTGLISVWLIRSISRPVFDLESAMHAVAEGDFTHKLRVPANREDEFGRLSASYETMAARLKELDQLKAEFISIASHELKTPINVILGYVELLQEGIYGRLSPEQRDVCDTITLQANNLTRLVRRLLDVSRFEAGGGKLEVRPFQLSAMFDSLQSSFKILAMQRGVSFKVTCGDDIPDEVRWDEDRMNEVIGNLLANAFKFTPRGGTVELSVSAAGEQIQIQVVDTGAGIPATQLPHVFQKFYQADNQSKADTKGTGLGLAIAKQIVEAHRGSISVESEVGRGTVFTILMPVKCDLRRSGPTPVTLSVAP